MDSLKEKAARYLLKLSEWLQCEHETLITEDLDSPLSRLVTGLPEVRPPFASPTIAAFIPVRDAAVGKLLQNSCEQFPELAKVWGAFGAWCYRWGKKMVELKADSGAATVKSGDITEIRKILGGVANDVDIDRIVEILNEHQITEEDEEVICDTSSSTVLIESQLRNSVACLAQETDSNLEAIVKIWKQSRRNIYSYYEMSADAYFRYLTLATASYVDPNADEQHDSSMITAALRILRLIVKHALGLQEVLEEGLASTPTTPWKIIIPQLFSRLNHPEPYVRRRVSELLCRVAADSPHLIIFPTVVGAVAQEKRLDIALNNSATGNFDLENCPATDSSGLICGFQSLLDTLSHQSPETVKQVKVLVHELKRIALLWDDLWLVSLTQIYIECSKKFKLFFEGATATDEHQKSKIDVASEKYRIVLLPVIFVMEKLHEVTSRKAETNYEKAFQDKYSKFIEETIVEMKTPSNVEKLTEGWQRFKTLFGRLKQQAHKRPQYTLKLTDISPVLAQLSNTSISMPGVDNKAGVSGEVFIK
jgi:serine/threonine-protein kinase SMG1